MKLPQLSLRDLFWLVALVAVGLGWAIERRVLQTQYLKSVGELRSDYIAMKRHIEEVDGLYLNRASDGTLQFGPK